uniref:Uncharacterized protein n=1 Tax=Quercus lobata TaxID=97700 RepID=A0A7N2MJ11_QUELO
MHVYFKAKLELNDVNVEGMELKPVAVGTSQNLHVVSGLGREIPSPNGRAIRGAIQTDADINAGTGVSSGVNFAITIDIVV